MLRFRDASWKRQMTEAIGHQGHDGRVAPWNWERQYASFFRQRDQEWTHVALDREAWATHKRPWLLHMLGSTWRAAQMGRY